MDGRKGGGGVGLKRSIIWGGMFLLMLSVRGREGMEKEGKGI